MFSGSIMPVFLSLFLLQSGGIRLDEGGGPKLLDEEHRSPFPVTVVDPGYPLDAFGEGSVILQVTPNANGNVKDVDVVAGVPSLSEPTAAAVRDWKFHVPSNRKPEDFSIVVAVFRSPKFNH